MNDLRIICAHAFREQLRSRFFAVSLVFGGVLIYMSVLLGTLAADQELRVLLDFGFSAIELLSTAAVAYAAAIGLILEMETKTIYLVFSRPVSRPAYLAGRWLGLLLSAACAIALMASMHLLLLFAKGWRWEPSYLLVLAGIGLKIAVTGALATLLALISTSVISGLLMTGVLWTLGHFVEEMRFLLARESLQAKALSILVYLAPNLQLFNFRDRLGAPELHQYVLLAFAYAPLYAAACLLLTVLLFRRREF
ncbi:MAG: hypothetical protein WCI75_16260 [candidate division NC10 bacterium]